jgi:hypothetical protein
MNEDAKPDSAPLAASSQVYRVFYVTDANTQIGKRLGELMDEVHKLEQDRNDWIVRARRLRTELGSMTGLSEKALTEIEEGSR